MASTLHLVRNRKPRQQKIEESNKKQGSIIMESKEKTKYKHISESGTHSMIFEKKVTRNKNR
jgi:hypothetical protein